ncbi:MAG: TadE/TadG family type IV pilus assembly protein [Rhizobiaceae bacterium]
MFWKNVSGNVALTVALMALPLLMAGGAAIDYTLQYNSRAALQDAVDAAALASVKELGLTSTKDENIESIAKSYVLANLAAATGHNPDTSDITVNTTISPSRRDVTVNVAYTWQPMILHLMDSKVLPLRVRATASLAGDESICVIALDGSASGGLAMTGRSLLHANDCAIYSNSADQRGIDIITGASLASVSTYSAGGFDGPLTGYKPTPITDSPGIADPLADRTPPSYSGCDHRDLLLDDPGGEVTLEPGVYCGGIRTVSDVVVKLNPGIYIMKDGPLIISGNSSLIGENVGFYFDGKYATYDFGVSTQVTLSAPKTGKMSGILFFEARNSIADRDFVIRSMDAERFEGTVYLPRGRFVVDKASRVGQLSNWTAIIAKQIEIKKGPSLQINADYGASDIPVPNGIGPTGTPRLTR